MLYHYNHFDYDKLDNIHPDLHNQFHLDQKFYFLYSNKKQRFIPGKSILAIIPIKISLKKNFKLFNDLPGNIIRNNGKNFNAPAKRHPALACVRFFAANVR